MTVDRSEIQTYYAGPAPMTDLKKYAHLVNDLPDDLRGLCQAIQGLCVHIFWAERYGIQLAGERKAEVNLRPAWRKMARLLELDPAPLDCARPLDRRLVCNCRDFSTLLCAVLRAKGIPARARCGFGVYFLPGHYEDHWVCEVWDAGEERWRWVDAQLDSFQIKALGITFDPLDLPPGQFITGGQAWQMCRTGQADPDAFGIFQWKGLDFVRGNLIRDLLALNKVEVLPWDFWGLLKTPLAGCAEKDLAELDQIAALTMDPDAAFASLLSLYSETAGSNRQKAGLFSVWNQTQSIVFGWGVSGRQAVVRSSARLQPARWGGDQDQPVGIGRMRPAGDQGQALIRGRKQPLRVRYAGFERLIALRQDHLIGQNVPEAGISRIHVDAGARFQVDQVAEHLSPHIVVPVENRIARHAQQGRTLQPSGYKRIWDQPLLYHLIAAFHNPVRYR